MINTDLFDIFKKTANETFADIDLSPALINMVDIVNSNALPILAAQFDVLGYKGWNMALTELQQRELIKTALHIKKHLGTPYAIKRALQAVGFDKVTIQEGVITGDSYAYDGTYLHDGVILYGGGNWASFSVTIRVPDATLVSDETKAEIIELILYYKNARSLLVEVIYLDDALNYYNGLNVYDGTITHT